MSSIIANWWGNKILHDYLTKGPVWLAWHTDNPTVTGDPATEVAGAGYIRQHIIFGESSSKTVANTNNLVFPNMPAVTVKWLSVWNAQTAGNMMWADDFTPFPVLESGQILVAVGDVAITL